MKTTKHDNPVFDRNDDIISGQDSPNTGQDEVNFNEETALLEEDLNELNFAEKNTWFLYILVVVSAVGGFLFGYDTGVISGAMIPLKRQFHLSNEYQEVVVSVTLVGAIISAISSAYLNDRFGRRIVLLIAAFSFMSGSIIMGVSVGVWSIIIGRLVVGFGIGYASMTVPIYIAEAVPTENRGSFVTTNQLMITFGIFMASLMNSLLSYVGGDGWRYMLGVGAIPGLIMFVGMFLLPESPRWLLIKGRPEEAEEVLMKLRGLSNVDAELEQLQTSLAHSTTESFWDTLKKIGKSRGVKRALLVGCGLQAFQQLSAINTVMYYSATIIEMAGIEDTTEILWYATMIAFGNFAVTIVTMFVIDRVKRRKLMIGSLCATAVGLLIIAFTFILVYVESARVSSSLSAPKFGLKNSSIIDSSPPPSTCRNYDRCFTCVEDAKCGFCYGDNPDPTNTAATYSTQQAFCLPINRTNLHQKYRPDNCPVPSSFGGNLTNDMVYHWSHMYCPSSAAWPLVTGMIFFLAAFAIGVGPLPWTINAELYPLWARNVCQGTATSTNWIFNLLISMTFLNMIELLTKAGVFIFYAVVTFGGAVFVYFLLPETKYVRLENAGRLFDGRFLVPFK